MPYYRLHNNLTIGNKILDTGSIQQLNNLSTEAIKTLLGKENISLVRFPSFAAIPNFDEKFELLEIVGIQDIETFLDICSCEIAAMLNMPDIIIESWKAEIFNHLQVKNDGCKCGDSRSIRN